MQTQSEGRADLNSEIRSDAQNLAGAAKNRLHDEVDARKTPLADQAKSVSSALGKAAGELSGDNAPRWLKSALEQGAQQIQRLAETIEQKDSRQLASSVRQMARENPVTFLTACAAAGFAASRIFRADAPDGNAQAAAPAAAQEQYGSYATQTAPTAEAGAII